MNTENFVYLHDIETFEIEQTVLRRTRDLLAKPGRNEREALALWAGSPRSETTFRISTALFPQQKATPLDVYVPPVGAQEVFDRLANEDLVLAGQVHTHPGEAFHSYTDDAFPLATQVGSLSVVVPNFAAGPLQDLSECAVYRLGEDGWGGPIADLELNELVQVVDGQISDGDPE